MTLELELIGECLELLDVLMWLPFLETSAQEKQNIVVRLKSEQFKSFKNWVTYTSS